MAQSAGRQRSGRTSSASKSTSVENGRLESGNGVIQNLTDLEFLRGLIDAVDQSGIDTLEINRAGTRIRIAKTPPASTALATYMPGSAGPSPAAAGAPAAASAAAPAGAEPATSPSGESGSAAPATNRLDVKSPMVGTFYRAPAPDAPPYVEVGSTVSRGQTLCILEAMKLMNELECEQDGVVREILVEDADPVEYGQVLFRIEPAGSK
jgi:acetyl-CoA carboxylase biotin carboxyl carrier protein